MDFLDGFGINFKILLAQIVNFTILLLILSKFAYKPILNMLDKRRETIKESLKKAESIEKEKSALEIEKAEILVKAREEAMKIVKEARLEIAKLKEEGTEKTKIEVQKMIKRAKETIEKDRIKMVDEVKKEVADIAILIASQVIQKNLDEQIDETLIDSAIEEARPQ